MTKTRALAFVVGGLALAALAATAPSVLWAEPSSPASMIDRPVGAVDVRTQALLHVFEQPRTHADELPQPVGGDPIKPDSLPGEAYDLSRRADPPGGPVFIWPKQNGACFSTEAVSSCADASDIEQRGVIAAFAMGPDIGEGVTRVTGIARDGIKSLTVGLTGGADVQVPVSENAFRVDVKGMPDQLRWTGAGGQQVQQLPSMGG